MYLKAKKRLSLNDSIQKYYACEDDIFFDYKN
jgi:hypothetical protein